MIIVLTVLNEGKSDPEPGDDDGTNEDIDTRGIRCIASK